MRTPTLLTQIEEAEYDLLYHQMQIDVRKDDFVNTSFGLHVWGYKP
jgi:hypothetical protein